MGYVGIGVLKNMVYDSNKFRNKYNSKFKTQHNLNCKDYGIYAGQCLLCFDLYVGQTKNSFASRWSSHRMMWKKLMENNAECISDEGRDDQALYMHYRIHHRNHLQKSAFALWDAFRVIFIEKPPIYLLDSKEDYWISKVNAGINIKNTILPRFKSTNY